MTYRHTEIRTWIDLLTPVLIGGIVFVSALVPIAQPTPHTVVDIIAAGVILGIGIPLIIGGLWIARTDHPTESRGRLAAWLLGGALPCAGFALAAVGYQYAHGKPVADPLLMTVWFAGGGALGGMINRTYYVQKRTARRTAESRKRELDHSYDLLERTEQLADVGGWSYDCQTETITWSKGALRIFGIPANSNPTVSEVIAFYHPDDRQKVRSGLQAAQFEGESSEDVLRITTSDGSLRWVRTVLNPVVDDGAVTIIRGAIMDITDLKKQTEVLRQYKLAIDSTTDWIVAVNQNYQYLFANPHYCEYHGIDPDAVSEYELGDVFSGDEFRTVTRHIDRALAGEAHNYQMCRDGRWLDVHYQPFTDETDMTSVVLVVIRDVTERKARLQNLQLFRNAVDNAGKAIVITEADGTITYVNPTWEAETGYTREEVVGQNPRILKSGKQSNRFYEDLWTTILDGNQWEAELINQRNTGELYLVEQTITPITDSDGDITHFIGVESDISDLRHREQRLTVLNRILRHNLRNAMTVVGGNAALLRQAVGDETLERYASAIIERADELTRISENAASVQSLFQRDLQTKPSCELTALFDELVNEFKDEFPDATISITAPESTFVQADDRLALAIREAVENAILHNPYPDPKVAISITHPDEQESGDWAVIDIADNGPGIPAIEQTVLETGEESSLIHGSGLGLWLIYWTVTGFGGELTINVNEDDGTVITFYLPKSPDERQVQDR